MRHSVDPIAISVFPLPERSPALAPGRRSLERLVQEMSERHPDWTPEAMRRAMFLRGLAADASLLQAVAEEQCGVLEDLRPARLVRQMLGL